MVLNSHYKIYGFPQHLRWFDHMHNGTGVRNTSNINGYLSLLSMHIRIINETYYAFRRTYTSRHLKHIWQKGPANKDNKIFISIQALQCSVQQLNKAHPKHITHTVVGCNSSHPPCSKNKQTFYIIVNYYYIIVNYYISSWGVSSNIIREFRTSPGL